MIIDNNLVLHEGAVSTKTGNPIALTSLTLPGKVEPIHIYTRFTQDLAGASNVALSLQQAPTEDGTFADIEGANLSIDIENFKVGKRVGWRFLPRSVIHPWLRLKMTVSGTATAGALFCAISGYEDEPYEEGQLVG